MCIRDRFFFGVAADAQAAEWVTQARVAALVRTISSGSVSIGGIKPAAEVMDADDGEPPAEPTLQILVRDMKTQELKAP
eukprot:15421165-Alexandrium_andersonii.AAC.1